MPTIPLAKLRKIFEICKFFCTFLLKWHRKMQFVVDFSNINQIPCRQWSPVRPRYQEELKTCRTIGSMSEVNQGFIGRILDYSPPQKPITSQRPPIFYTSKQFYVCYSVQRKTHDLFDPFDPICDNVLKYSQFHKIALRRKGSKGQKGQKGHSFFLRVWIKITGYIHSIYRVRSDTTFAR